MFVANSRSVDSDPTAAIEVSTAQTLLAIGLIGVLCGALLSGPVALLIQTLTHPQPAWQSAEVFAANYHPVQLLPFAFGLILVAGFVLTIAALSRLAPPALRARTTAALLFAASFAALIFLNYTIQIGLVPSLVEPWSSDNEPLLTALTMSNPASLGWNLEMFGYGLLGVATWLCAPVLSGPSAAGRAAAWCFAVNGPISVAGALATAVARDWLLQPSGLWAFGLWNVLVIAMGTLALWSLLPLLAAARATLA